MSAIQEQLFIRLSGVATIHPMLAPQGSVLPYVTYQRVASNINNVLFGPPSIDNIRIQIDVWAGTYAGAQTLADAIKASMQGWAVQNTLQNEYDLYEQAVQTFRVLLEFSIWQ
jgi:hypothetical protein